MVRTAVEGAILKRLLIISIAIRGVRVPRHEGSVPPGIAVSILATAFSMVPVMVTVALLGSLRLMGRVQVKSGVEAWAT